MAKRFMDTDLWNKKWFRELPVRLKIVWFYLINKCNHAGIWECDIDLLSFQIGENYTLKEILEAFGDNLKEIGDNKIFITKFCKFQYGELNPSVRVHQSVMKLLQKHNIDLDKSLLSVSDKLLSVKDKEKEKDKGKDINTKKEEFAKRVEKEVFDMNLDPNMIKEFIEYWTEHNDGGRVLRYEQQSIFNVRKRISTWKKNSKKFNSNMKFQSASDEDIKKREERIEADYQEQQKRFKEADENTASDEERKRELGLL